MWKTMLKFLVRFFALLGLMNVLFFILVLFLANLVEPESLIKKDIADGTILELDLNQLPAEIVVDPLSDIRPSLQLSLRDVVEAIDQASTDTKVRALILRLRFYDGGIVGFAKIQEIRDALSRFRQAGKQVVAFADTFGEGFAGNQAYYLATACDTIYLQPSGEVGLNGLVWETPFLKEGLKEWGIEFDVFKRHDYKTAFNSFSEAGMTEAQKEVTESILNSLMSQVTAGIVQGRSLNSNSVIGLINEGPFSSDEAVDKKLVDGLFYYDEVIDSVKDQVGSSSELLYLHKYFQRRGRPHQNGPKVALIYGVGPVQRGAADPSPFASFEDPVMAADTVSKALQQAIQDESVRAILFRVDSPGGSYVASDTIWRQVMKAREAQKPFIVSMGDMAGSGGYFVAMPADTIIAEPGTLTGSIGVISAKLNTKEFWENLKVNWEHSQIGDNANMLSSTHELTEKQRDKMNVMLDRIYDDFVSKAAQARGLSQDAMHKIAQGRVWTGQEAKEIGLVDDIGGWHEAIVHVKKAIGLKSTDSINLQIYPPKMTFIEQWIGQDPDNSEDTRSHPFTLKTPALVQQILKLKNQIFESQVLSMPVFY